MNPHIKDVAVIGGSVSGLAAAHRFNSIDNIGEVRVFERQEYSDKRVDCGEAINDSTLVPLEKTESNGFLNNVDGFQLRVLNGMDRDPNEEPLGISNLRCEAGYICDRDVVEQRWAESLSESGVIFETGHSVTHSKYHEIVEQYDYIVDATGQPSLTHKVHNRVPEYTGDMVALNATVEGDFSEYSTYPRIYFEGYVGYSWSFPKSEHHANVGIGWAGDQRPDDYMSAFEAAAERNGFPVPNRKEVNIYTIPRGPSLNPENTHVSDSNVFLVGDAAGIANRYQGEGICQGIRSSYLLADLIANDCSEQYSDKLYDLMKSEYRLAHLMRGAWVEHENHHLLAAVAEALEGMTINQITRSPNMVIRRLLRHPGVTMDLIADGGMIKRVYDSYMNKWEYTDSGLLAENNE